MSSPVIVLPLPPGHASWPLTAPASAGATDADHDPDHGLDAVTCLRLYRKFAGGVTIVTSRDRNGPIGTTVTSVTSLSLEPPLLLVCLRGGSRTLAAVREQQAFAVHLLQSDQQAHAQAFSRPFGDAAARLAAFRWTEVSGVPVLEDTLTWATCTVVDEHVHGDHSVVVGRVTAADAADPADPLIWHDRSYWGLDPVLRPRTDGHA